jgi:hypothetical protein
MNEMVRYENAKRALAEYRTIDEVKHFRDVAFAAEAYAKQANDYQLEHDAAAARVRAERRCGELLAQMELAKGTRGQLVGPGVIGGKDDRPPTDQPKTLSDMGITKDQSSKWKKLAAVPEAEFEDAISQVAAKPSATSILRKSNPEPKPEPERMDADVLWWWGRFCDMEKGKFSAPLSEVVNQMTDAMQRDALRIIPQLKRWVNDYE